MPARLSAGNFPADLLMVAVMPARLSATNFPADLLMVSVMPARLSAGNFPADLLMVSAGALFSVKLWAVDMPERRAGHWCMSLYEALVG